MATKYIVDNLSSQTITGDLTINGNLFVTGTSTSTLATYRALLTQTGNVTGTGLNDFGLELIIGEIYTIDTYQSGDDFSNVANVISGVINQSACQFIATGSTPTSWSNGSQLTSNGGIVVNVLENNLGYDIDWIQTPFGGSGYYFGINSLFGPFSGAFPRNNTTVTCQVKYPYNWPGFPYINIFPNVGSAMGIDDIIVVNVLDYDAGMEVDNALYYNPIEINVLQDMTPLVVSGSVDSSYPIDNVSVRLYCDGSTVDTFYGNTDNANNISELVTILNSDPDTNILGTYSDAGDGGVLLTMSTHNANIFCPSGTLTFEVFAD